MSKPTMRLCISSVDLVLGIVFRAVVVRELDEPLSVGHMFPVRYRAGAVIAQEVQIELCLGEFGLLDDLHAQELVELDWYGSTPSADNPPQVLQPSTYQTPSGPSPES